MTILATDERRVVLWTDGQVDRCFKRTVVTEDALTEQTWGGRYGNVHFGAAVLDGRAIATGSTATHFEMPDGDLGFVGVNGHEGAYVPNERPVLIFEVFNRDVVRQGAAVELLGLGPAGYASEMWIPIRPALVPTREGFAVAVARGSSASCSAPTTAPEFASGALTAKAPRVRKFCSAGSPPRSSSRSGADRRSRNQLGFSQMNSTAASIAGPPRPRVVRRAITVLALAVLTTVPGAHASDPGGAPSLGPGAPPAAESRYQSGRALYNQGKFADAAQEFRVALGIWPQSARLAFNLARSLERAQAPDEAVAAYLQYISLAPDAPDRSQIDAVVRAHLVQRARAAVQVRTSPSGAVIIVDRKRDAPRGTTPAFLILPAGDRVVRVELAGRGPEERKLALVAGARVELDLELRSLPATPPAAKPATVAATRPAPTPVAATKPSPIAATKPAPAPAATDWRVPVAYGAFGASVLAIGVGVYSAWSGTEAVDASSSLGPDDTRRHAALEDDLTAAQVGMGLGFGLGAALAATGTYLWLTRESSGVTLLPQRGGASVLVEF